MPSSCIVADELAWATTFADAVIAALTRADEEAFISAMAVLAANVAEDELVQLSSILGVCNEIISLAELEVVISKSESVDMRLRNSSLEELEQEMAESDGPSMNIFVFSL